ncbi:MAG: hypothetical protein SaNV5_gp2 [Sanya narnavirus 5]|nr:MAG: hypothetical protein SaNV5_gp2 [Sanya narnavirus 5]
MTEQAQLRGIRLPHSRTSFHLDKTRQKGCNRNVRRTHHLYTTYQSVDLPTTLKRTVDVKSFPDGGSPAGRDDHAPVKQGFQSANVTREGRRSKNELGQAVTHKRAPLKCQKRFICFRLERGGPLRERYFSYLLLERVPIHAPLHDIEGADPPTKFGGPMRGCVTDNLTVPKGTDQSNKSRFLWDSSSTQFDDRMNWDTGFHGANYQHLVVRHDLSMSDLPRSLGEGRGPLGKPSPNVTNLHLPPIRGMKESRERNIIEELYARYFHFLAEDFVTETNLPRGNRTFAPLNIDSLFGEDSALTTNNRLGPIDLKTDLFHTRQISARIPKYPDEVVPSNQMWAAAVFRSHYGKLVQQGESEETEGSSHLYSPSSRHHSSVRINGFNWSHDLTNMVQTPRRSINGRKYSLPERITVKVRHVVRSVREIAANYDSTGVEGLFDKIFEFVGSNESVKVEVPLIFKHRKYLSADDVTNEEGGGRESNNRSGFVPAFGDSVDFSPQNRVGSVLMDRRVKDEFIGLGFGVITKSNRNGSLGVPFPCVVSQLSHAPTFRRVIKERRDFLIRVYTDATPDLIPPCTAEFVCKLVNLVCQLQIHIAPSSDDAHVIFHSASDDQHVPFWETTSDAGDLSSLCRSPAASLKPFEKRLRNAARLLQRQLISSAHRPSPIKEADTFDLFRNKQSAMVGVGTSDDPSNKQFDGNDVCDWPLQYAIDVSTYCSPHLRDKLSLFRFHRGRSWDFNPTPSPDNTRGTRPRKRIQR